MTTAAKKSFVTKSITVGLEENTLKAINDAAKAVDASNDSTVLVGGTVPRNADSTEYYNSSVTFTWSEEV